MKNLLFMLMLTVSSTIVYSQEWKLIKETQDGILVYSRPNDLSSFHEVRALDTINYSLDKLITLLTDFDNVTDWGFKVKKSKLLSRENDTTWVAYYQMEIPWPLKDRDMINRVRLIKTDNGARLEASTAFEYIDEKKDIVRMKVAQGFWEFEKLDENTTYAIYQYIADPEGIPAWIGNMMLSEAPVATFNGMKRELKKL